jgi:hypothetical protein
MNRTRLLTIPAMSFLGAWAAWLWGIVLGTLGAL